MAVRRNTPDTALIAALEDERVGYERYGRTDRVAEVDDQIKLIRKQPPPDRKPASAPKPADTGDVPTVH
jgi:hypothetical protein